MKARPITKRSTNKTKCGVKIPRGYFELEHGSTVEQGDLFWDGHTWETSSNWRSVFGEFRVGDNPYPYIRRIDF